MSLIKALATSFVLYLLYRLSRVGMRPKDFPPGPPTMPIIGNLHQIGKIPWHIQLQKWAEEYGPLISIRYGTSTMIVVTSPGIVRDLFDKRGAIYAARPDSYLNHVWQGLNPIMRTNDDIWRMQRRLYHVMLSIKTINQYVPYQDLENVQMLHEFLHKPEQFVQHIRRYSTSLTTTMVYGWRSPVFDVPYIKELYAEMDQFFHLIQHALLFDWFPFLRTLAPIIPTWLISTREKANECFQVEKRLFTELYDRAKQDEADDNLIPCLAKDVIIGQRKEGFSDVIGAFIAGLAFQGGSDTTSNTLWGFVKAMAIFPAAQRKLQEELDQVVGPNRLPSVEDENDLPYVRCCMKEILRWMPTGITGVPHSLSQDDDYMGYRLPKGSSIIINVWSIHHDEKRYPNPREFDPDRYKGDNTTSFESATQSDNEKRDHFGFGSGRRMCPGTHVADRSLFLAIARFGWAFNFSRARDPNGGEIPIDRDGIVSSNGAYPEHFVCSIVPRDERRAELIEQTWKRKKNTVLNDEFQYKDAASLMK